MTSPLPDITEKIRQHPSYQKRQSANEKHENNENLPLLSANSSFNSSFSSFASQGPRLQDVALYGITGEIVRRHHGVTEADPAAILAQLLASVGSLIGPGPFFLADGARHHLNLFTVICGRTAKARKGTSWARVKNVLSEIDDLWLSTRVKSGVVSGEGITQVFNDDDDRRLLLIESEFGQVLQAMKREGNTVSMLLRQAWDGTRLAVLRRTNKIEVDGAHVSMIGHITLPELHQLLASVEISNGLANRCLWIYAERAGLLPEGGDPPNLQEPLSQLAHAIDNARSRGQVNRAAESTELWSEIYSDLSQEHPGRLGELLSRGEAQVMRLALLYALLDEAPAIGISHLQAALEFWRYCEASARFIFAGHLMSKKAGIILQSLESGPQSTTELHRLFGNNAKRAEIESALEEIANQIVIEPNGKGGGKTIRLASHATPSSTIFSR